MTVPPDLLRFVIAHRNELTLSIYAEATDPAARRNWLALLLQQLSQARASIAQKKERDNFDWCAELLRERLPTAVSLPADSAWAGFCVADDILVLTIPTGVMTSARWGPGADIVPYLRVKDDESALVIQLDWQHARVSRLEHGAPRLIAEYTAEAGGRGHCAHGKGRRPRRLPQQSSARRLRTLRPRQESAEQMQVALARELAALAEQEVPIVVGSAPGPAAQFARRLPAPLAGCVAFSPLLPADPPFALYAIRHEMHALRDRRQQQRVAALVDEARHSSRVAIGYEAVANAAAHGAIAELMFSELAWLRSPLEIEHIVRRAIADRARVSWADRFEAGDGVIAGLRFSVPEIRW